MPNKSEQILNRAFAMWWARWNAENPAPPRPSRIKSLLRGLLRLPLSDQGQRMVDYWELRDSAIHAAIVGIGDSMSPPDSEWFAHVTVDDFPTVEYHVTCSSSNDTTG